MKTRASEWRAMLACAIPSAAEFGQSQMFLLIFLDYSLDLNFVLISASLGIVQTRLALRSFARNFYAEGVTTSLSISTMLFGVKKYITPYFFAVQSYVCVHQISKKSPKSFKNFGQNKLITRPTLTFICSPFSIKKRAANSSIAPTEKERSPLPSQAMGIKKNEIYFKKSIVQPKYDSFFLIRVKGEKAKGERRQAANENDNCLNPTRLLDYSITPAKAGLSSLSSKH